MSDEASLHVGEAIAIDAPDGARPERVAITCLADGSIWVVSHVLSSDGAHASIVAVRRDATRAGAPRVLVEGDRDALRLGGVVAHGDTLACGVRDASGDAALLLVDTSSAHAAIRSRSFGPSGSAPRVSIDPATNEFVSLVERGHAVELVNSDGSTSRDAIVPDGAHDVDFAIGGPALACVFVRDRAVHLVDADGMQRVEPLSTRARAHAPCATRVGSQWGVAWVSEDTGKLVMARARLGEPPSRVAEVWAALERPWASAPTLVGYASGAWIAWREERGPRAGVYLRRLDAELH